MKQFLQDCLAANANWRAQAYETLVKQHGIYVGAAIKVKHRTGYGSNAKENAGIALVTSVNFDTMNVTCAMRGYGDYRQPLTIEIVHDGRAEELHFSDSKLLAPVFQRVNSYGSIQYDSKVCDSSTPLDPSWVTEYKDAFEWLVKKRSYEKLDEEGIVHVVEQWK